MSGRHPWHEIRAKRPPGESSEIRKERPPLFYSPQDFLEQLLNGRADEFTERERMRLLFPYDGDHPNDER